jgi:hypothetical protein
MVPDFPIYGPKIEFSSYNDISLNFAIDPREYNTIELKPFVAIHPDCLFKEGKEWKET